MAEWGEHNVQYYEELRLHSSRDPFVSSRSYLDGNDEVGDKLHPICDIAPYEYEIEDDEAAYFTESMLEFGGSSSSYFQARKVSQNCVSTFRRRLCEYSMLIAVVSAWLGCSCMNSNAMKELEQGLHHKDIFNHRRRLVPENFDSISGENGSSQSDTNENEYLLCIVAMTSIATAVQLLFGALLGSLLVLLHSRVRCRSAKHAIIQCFTTPHYCCSQNNNSVALPALHAVATVFSNLGFMHDSASLVKIIKLLEPLETLVLTNLFLGGSPERRKLTIGVFSSVLLTVSAAFFTIKTSQLETQYDGVAVALVAGIAMSSRNVLKRHQLQELAVPTKVDVPRRQDYRNFLRVSTATLTQREISATKFERALVHFTRLSFQSGIYMSVMAGLCHCTFFGISPVYRGAIGQYLAAENGRILGWGVVSWHPLYSACSIMALCFCSALTHSLVSAGQGVVSVSMEILWFQQPVTAAYASSLALVSFGACWYILESKQAEVAARLSIDSRTRHNSNQQQPATSSAPLLLRWGKPLMAVALLNLVAAVSSIDSLEY
jgi:hypothetical protein